MKTKDLQKAAQELTDVDLDDFRMTKGHLHLLSDLCLACGFASIFISIAAWWAAKEPEVARGERLGIFVGLWVPSFFILSNRLARKAEEM